MKRTKNSIQLLFFLFLFLFHISSFAIYKGIELENRLRPEVIQIFIAATPEQIPSTASTWTTSELLQLRHCTGVAISDHTLLTTAHCLVFLSDNPAQHTIDNAELENSRDVYILENLSPLKVKKNIKLTSFLNTKIDKVFIPQNQTQSVVAGCSENNPKEFFTKTPDIAQIEFAPNTFKVWAQIDFNYVPKLNQELEVFGYGFKLNSFVTSYFYFNLTERDLAYFKTKIWRINSQRASILAQAIGPFADEGDEGGPVFYNNKLVALVSSTDEKCESELGDDYGIRNTLSFITSKTLKINKPIK